uniref:Uncharacterized protein n=1 Tax=uncultured marine thaumarchaeote AD1000_44_E12 TaxID=1455918 RepID=A0A075FSG1_9ARCH|nr:hypothetical protein [uncultured marine thaumarchaeote AD1000_44_E12]
MHAGSNLPIIAPIRDLNLDRTEELKFAKKHGIKIENVAKNLALIKTYGVVRLKVEF